MNQATDAEIIAAVQKCGTLTQAAKSLRITRQTCYNRAQKNPAILQSLRQSREELIDQAENVLREKLKSGDVKTAMFILRFLSQPIRFPLTAREQVQMINEIEI